MSRIAIICLALLLTACVDRTMTTEIGIGPKAAAKAEMIFEAADQLNALVGEDVFTVSPSTGNGYIDGVANVTIVDSLKPVGKMTVGAVTHRDRRGVQIQLLMRTKLIQVMHEMGHAAGLAHVADTGNFMYIAPSVMGMSDEQREHLLAVAGIETEE
jgi:hypothetical protein